MGRWYQVFDDEQVNVVTRVAARRHAAAAVVLGLLTGSAFLAVYFGLLSALPVFLAMTGLWGLAGSALMARWHALRSQVWCVKFSDREIVGYDYRRRRIRIDWIDARRIDIEARGLAVTSTRDVRLEIPVTFPDYTDLCHALLEHADFYEIPVFVDGKELWAVRASALFPFLDEAGDSPAGSG